MVFNRRTRQSSQQIPDDINYNFIEDSSLTGNLESTCTTCFNCVHPVIFLFDCARLSSGVNSAKFRLEPKKWCDSFNCDCIAQSGFKYFVFWKLPWEIHRAPSVWRPGRFGLTPRLIDCVWVVDLTLCRSRPLKCRVPSFLFCSPLFCTVVLQFQPKSDPWAEKKLLIRDVLWCFLVASARWYNPVWLTGL